MIISHKYKYIFIKTKKTAGTSVEVYLNKFRDKNDVFTTIGIEKETIEHKAMNYKGFFNPINELGYKRKISHIRKTFTNLTTLKKFYNHIPAYLVESRIPKKIWDSYYKFCIERNPWDKTISHYYMMNKKNHNKLPFDDYISKGDFCYNFPFYMDYKQNRIIVDRIIKYENLQSELVDVFKHLDIPFNGKLGVRAKSDIRKDKRSYQDFFSGEYDKYKDTISQAFNKEILLHNYRF